MKRIFCMLVISALIMGSALVPLNGEEVKRTKAEKQVLEILKKFQAGYDTRDVSKLDEYVSAIFDPDDCCIAGTISSGPGTREWCEGIDEVKKLVKFDWEQWDDLKLKVDESRIRVNGNTAWAAMWGISHAVKEKKPEYDRCLAMVARVIEMTKNDKTEEMSLSVMLWVLKRVSKYLERYVLEGNEYRYPIRVTMALTKKKGKWLIRFVDFAFPDDDIPDVMLLD